MKSRSLLLASTLLVLYPLGGAVSQTALDGDTIELLGARYRLWGIDTAESKQTCSDGWPAGLEATAHLRSLMVGRSISCDPRTKDRYGRTVAVCRADGRDLGAAMVRAGMAWAFTRYSRDYVVLEEQAKMQGLGVHAHDCVAAWEWRVRNRGDQ